MRIAVLATALASAVVGVTLADPVAAAIKTPTNIAAQELGSALRVLAADRHLQILYTTETVANRHTSGAIGEFTVNEALTQLLGGTGLVFRYIDDSTITITLREEGTSVSPAATQPALEKEVVEEIVVTGTHIRGVTNSASPLITIDRQDIQRSGIGTLDRFLLTIPQNVGGGRTPYSNVFVGGDQQNYSQGTGVDLRGLGDDATLILVNGRRMAPSALGGFTDTSTIPVDAVERIDVLADGASAIYGSDAVGGVINIILRKDYEGLGTRLVYGSTIDGDFAEPQASLTAGNHWGSGSVLFSYDFLDHDPLDSQDRSFTRDALDPTTLINGQRRHSALAHLTQQVGNRTNLNADVLYSSNETESSGTSVATSTTGFSSYDSKQLTTTLGATVELPRAWAGDFAATYGRNRVDFQNLFGGVNTLPLGTVGEVSSVDAKFDGLLARLPGGSVKLAVGGQYREETFDSTKARFPTPGKMSREVSSAFVELFVPLVGADNGHAGLRRLELTLAGRLESYSDFGETTNPKFGLAWSPVEGLNVRGTYGTSFTAPLLSELNEGSLRSGRSAFLFPLNDPVQGRLISIFLTSGGGNANLGPEESKNWTAGFDLHPVNAPDWGLSFTYFNIEHKDRIASALVGSASGVLANEALNPTVVIRNPSAAMVAEFFPLATDPLRTGATPANIAVIVDGRQQNIAGRFEDGIDLSVSYQRDTGVGAFRANLAGTYFFKLDQQATPTVPALQLLNTVYSPVDLRVRGALTWSRSVWNAGLFVNYTDDYRDIRAGSVGPVSSWTTVDISLGYQSHETGGMLSGFSASLNVQNLFDKAPPFVANSEGMFFDSSNANPLGSFASLELRKRW